MAVVVNEEFLSLLNTRQDDRDQWKQYFMAQLNDIRTKIKRLRQDQQNLECNQAALTNEIGALKEEMASVPVTQECYKDVHRITNSTQLKILSAAFTTDTYHVFGQVVRKKHFPTVIFFDVIIARKHLVQISIKKRRFDKTFCYNIRSDCALGSIIECRGSLEYDRDNKLVLDADMMQVVRAYPRSAFVAYKEPNLDKRKQILCSHFVKHFVRTIDAESKTDMNPLQLNVKFIPAICRNRKPVKCVFRHQIVHRDEISKILQLSQGRNRVLDAEFDANDPFAEQTKDRKKVRANLFGGWVIQKYGLQTLQQRGVLDIAGGGGDLASFLASHDIPVTIIDPRTPRKMNRKIGKQQKKQHKKTAQQDVLVPQHIDAYFEWTTLSQNARIRQIFDECEVVLGLHPDQATEPIVDVALKHGKQFAVLPCCVFANLYPKYMLINGTQAEVTTYMQMVEYLRQKHADICTDYLPFKGRNKILYFDASQKR